jgi:hypothetical protein
MSDIPNIEAVEVTFPENDYTVTIILTLVLVSRCARCRAPPALHAAAWRRSACGPRPDAWDLPRNRPPCRLARLAASADACAPPQGGLGVFLVGNYILYQWAQSQRTPVGKKFKGKKHAKRESLKQGMSMPE